MFFNMATLCSDAVQVPLLRLCSYLLFYVVLLSLFTHITSALTTYDKGTLLDIGQCYTNLFQDTLSTNPTWPLEILWNAEENNGHLHNPQRRRIKKHHGKRAGIRNRLRKRAHSHPLPSILLTNVQSLENKMDDLRARISFQRDIKDCNILCLSETWLTTSVPDTAVMPSDNFSVLQMDRTAKAGKTKGGGSGFHDQQEMVWPQEYLHSVALLLASSGISVQYLPPILSNLRVFIDHCNCCLHSTTGRHWLGFV